MLAADDLLVRPASAISGVQCSELNSCYLSPFIDGAVHAHVTEPYGAVLIVLLLARSCPSNVAGLVVAIVVNSVQ